MTDLDVQWFANEAAAKIRGGKKAPHAVNSVLEDHEFRGEEREILYRKILRELSRRAQIRKRTLKKAREERIAYETTYAKEIQKEECDREARRMAYERGDHLLYDP